MKIDQRISITELVGSVFPRMNPSTIHLWMKKGIFRPLVKARGRHGCELDLYDAVTVGILHSLFALGATFNELPLRGSARTEQQNPLGFVGTESVLVDTKLEHAWRLEGRPIQRYLEYTDFRCYVHYEPKHLKDFETNETHFRANINFFPEKYIDIYLDKVKGVNFVVAHAFINVREWHRAVTESLGI